MKLVTKTTVEKTFEDAMYGVAVIGAQMPVVYAVFGDGAGQSAAKAADAYVAERDHLTLKTIRVFVPEMDVDEEGDDA